MTKTRSEFVEHLLELLAPLGEVRARRMFGGHGLYSGDLMFGIVDDDVLYLKVDEENRAAYEERELPWFTYIKQGKTQRIAYRQPPEEALEDASELCGWARGAIDAALRAAAAKRAGKRRRSGSPRRGAPRRGRTAGP